jgi:hypothetical protein
MVSVVTDNPLIQRSLLRIATLAEAAGAAFHSDLVVKCIDGTMSVEAPPDSVGAILMRLPWDCLVPVTLFEFSVAGDEISITSHDPGITGSCVAMMEAMAELYNLTHKLAEHRRASPWCLAASHPELLPNVMIERQARLQGAIASGNRGEFELRSFFNARLFGYSDTPKVMTFPVLLPILDAMNHHPQGERFRYDDRSERGQVLQIARSKPLPGTGDECFACYGNHDGYDTWMSYGLIDESPRFLRSRAMRIELPGLGTMQITEVPGTRVITALPPPVRDLHFYLPKLRRKREREIETSSVLVPGPQAPRALRRVLSLLIAELSPGRPVQRDLVLHAEQQIIAGNAEYYRTLKAALHGITLEDGLQQPILDNFIRMCDIQLRWLGDYPGYAQG